MKNRHSETDSPDAWGDSNQPSQTRAFLSSTSMRLFIVVSIFMAVGLSIYFVWLFFAKVDFSARSVPPPKSTDPQEIEKAEKVIKNLLDENSKGFVTSYEEKENKIYVKVEGKKWNDHTYDEKKEFIRTLAEARGTLGFFPQVIVKDNKKPIEYGSSISEHRVMLIEDEM